MGRQQSGDQVTIFDAFPVQTEYINTFLQGKHFMYYYGGAAGGGKTWVHFAILLLCCFRYPGTRYLVIREDLPKIKSTLLPTLYKLIPPSQIAKKFNDSDKTVKLKNGSEILLMPEKYAEDKDGDQFRGLEINGAFADEVTEIQKSTIDIIKTRVGRWTPAATKENPTQARPKPFILLSSNPAHNWVKDEIHIPWTLGKLPDYIHYQRALMSDNDKLDEFYLENQTIEKLGAYNFARFTQGDWDAKLEGELIRVENFNKIHELPDHVKNLPVNVTIDSSFTEQAHKTNDPNAFCIYVTDRKDVYILDAYEAYLGMPELIKHCKEIKAKYGNNTTFRVEPKASGQSLIQMLIKENLIVTRTKWAHLSKLERANMITPFVDNGKVYILAFAKLQKFLEQLGIFPLKGVHDDMVDAFCYSLLESLFRSKTTAATK